MLFVTPCLALVVILEIYWTVNGELGIHDCIMNWNETKERLYNTTSTLLLHELISIRDGYQECIGFTRNEIVTYISYKTCECAGIQLSVNFFL